MEALNLIHPTVLTHGESSLRGELEKARDGLKRVHAVFKGVCEYLEAPSSYAGQVERAKELLQTPFSFSPPPLNAQGALEERVDAFCIELFVDEVTNDQARLREALESSITPIPKILETFLKRPGRLDYVS